MSMGTTELHYMAPVIYEEQQTIHILFFASEHASCMTVLESECKCQIHLIILTPMSLCMMSHLSIGEVRQPKLN